MRKTCTALCLLIALFLVALAPVHAQEKAPVVHCVASTPCAGAVAQPLTALKFSAGAAESVISVPAATANNGFGLANVIMVVMLLSLLYALMATVQIGRGATWPVTPGWADVLIPLLAVVGLGVALYLTYVETRQVAAVCGPVGDCNAVQASPYARLFGRLPVGLLGAMGYVAMLAAWVLGRFTTGRIAQLAPLALFGMALFGVLFSVYLTYLELAVILAVCIWCLSSAVIMSLILVLSVGPALDAMAPAEIEAE